MNHSGKAWREGRKATLQRDNHRCQDCGRFNELHVHHIKQPEEFEEYEAGHNPSNLVTLCKWCHPNWEGREARPILLEEGYTLQSIVADLTTDTVERLTHRNAAESMLDFLVLKNERACNKCFRPKGEYSTQPAAHLHAYIKTVVQNLVYGEDMDLPVRTTSRGWKVCEDLTEYYCDTCAVAYRYYNDDVGMNDYIRAAWRISEALAAQGVEHDGERLADVARHLKSTKRVKDRIQHTAATACAIRAGHGEVNRPEWLRDTAD